MAALITDIVTELTTDLAAPPLVMLNAYKQVGPRDRNGGFRH